MYYSFSRSVIRLQKYIKKASHCFLYVSHFCDKVTKSFFSLHIHKKMHRESLPSALRILNLTNIILKDLFLFLLPKYQCPSNMRIRKPQDKRNYQIQNYAETNHSCLFLRNGFLLFCNKCPDITFHIASCYIRSYCPCPSSATFPPSSFSGPSSDLEFLWAYSVGDIP